MQKKSVLAASLFLVMCCGITAQAQETLITGKVNNAGKEAIPSVSIMIKGAIFGTVTDDQGKFKLTVKKLPVTLLFSSISYEPLEIIVNNNGSDIVHWLRRRPLLLPHLRNFINLRVHMQTRVDPKLVRSNSTRFLTR